MDASPFARILGELVARIPGAHAAALVDSEGETVDYAAGRADPFEVKVAAAHLRIVLNEIARSPLGHPTSLVVRGTHASFLARSLPDGYAVVVMLRKRAGFASTSRALTVCERRLHAEANWPPVERRGAWYPVYVRAEAGARPKFVGAAGSRGEPVEVLGAVMGLARGERGFRVRLASGVELTLVREPGGFWYADEPVP